MNAASLCLLLAGLPHLLPACSSAGREEGSCEAEVSQPLINATPTEIYLGISRQQQGAIVAIVDEADESSRCSGTFVAAEWVLTAAHCDELTIASVVVSPGGGARGARFAVVHRELHATLDLALFRVALTSRPTESNEPEPAVVELVGFDIEAVATPRGELTSLAPGFGVELAGHGVDEVGNAGELGFLVEPIVAVTPGEVTVFGAGGSGACQGDSGGPLLLRDADGWLTVGGVLSRGSNTCLHQDIYTRTDNPRVGDWIQTVTGGYAFGSPRCGTIPSEGRCLYGSALWCDEGSLAAEACGSASVCGWNASVEGFRCVPVGSPCAGVDGAGECRDGRSVRCLAGRLEQDQCDTCSSCRRDIHTGVASCWTEP